MIGVAHLSYSQRQVQLRHRSSVRKGEGIVVIKFLGFVRVDKDRACLLGLLYSHTLILSRSKQDWGSNTVFLPSKNTGFLSSPLVTDPDVSPSAGEGEEGQRLGRHPQRGWRPTAGRTVISGRAPAREILRSLCCFPTMGGSGLSPPTYPHPDDLQVYLPSKPP